MGLSKKKPARVVRNIKVSPLEFMNSNDLFPEFPLFEYLYFYTKIYIQPGNNFYDYEIDGSAEVNEDGSKIAFVEQQTPKPNTADK